MIDHQSSPSKQPRDSKYIDQDAGFTEEGVFSGDKSVGSTDPAFARYHYFF